MNKISLTDAEANHILLLLKDNEREEWYYSPFKQYWARHNRIKKKLCDVRNVNFENYIPPYEDEQD